MPKFVHRLFEGGGVAVWRIDESVGCLRQMLRTDFYDDQLSTMRNEVRQAEWLAVRVLLQEVLGADKKIAYLPSGKPYLIDGSCHISISHTKGYAALAYHDMSAIGVDVEVISPRVQRVAHRFIHPEEAAYMDVGDAHERLVMQLVNWSAKETLYKLVDDSLAADFLSVFCISPYELALQGVIEVDVALAGYGSVAVCYERFPEFVCTWAVGSELEGVSGG